MGRFADGVSGTGDVIRLSSSTADHSSSLELLRTDGITKRIGCFEAGGLVASDRTVLLRAAQLRSGGASSSESETSYKSSNSVFSVATLARFQGFEDVVGELPSAETVDGDDGRTGADRKLTPRGVGK